MTSGDPWRYRCPREHSNWRSAGAGYHYWTCKDAFDELVDTKMAADADEPPTPIVDDPCMSTSRPAASGLSSVAPPRLTLTAPATKTPGTSRVTTFGGASPSDSSSTKG
jgi:hypothetical protein